MLHYLLSMLPAHNRMHIQPDGIPVQVDTDSGPRGHQVGYNVSAIMIALKQAYLGLFDLTRIAAGF